jgi:hypothetical protein
MYSEPLTWCGYCDERTRLVDLGDTATRCQQCHRNRRAQLAQHRKCPQCNATVYAWDFAPCGQHTGPAGGTDTRPSREQILQIIDEARG